MKKGIKKLNQSKLSVRGLQKAEVKSTADYIRVLMADKAVKELKARGVIIPDIMHIDAKKHLTLKGWEETEFTGDGWKMLINMKMGKKYVGGKEVSVMSCRKLILVDSAHTDKIHDYYLIKLG